MSRRVIRVADRDFARGGTGGRGGCAVWVGEGRRGGECGCGTVGWVRDRVVFDAGDRAGDAGDHELRVVFSLSLSLCLTSADVNNCFLDYASVVFVGFAVISAVWYSISTSSHSVHLAC